MGAFTPWTSGSALSSQGITIYSTFPFTSVIPKHMKCVLCFQTQKKKYLPSTYWSVSIACLLCGDLKPQTIPPVDGRRHWVLANALWTICQATETFILSHSGSVWAKENELKALVQIGICKIVFHKFRFWENLLTWHSFIGSEHGSYMQ
jgi:hypothetical protein